MRSIGNGPPLSSDYKMSVLAAWRMSIAAIPEKTANLLYLLCFLDRTNLSKDLLKRACSTKAHWNHAGQLDELHPNASGVPEWLLDLFCDRNGQWSEFQYHEVVSQLSSFFFVEKEVLTGQWRHHSGTVDIESLTTHGEIPELLKIPQPVHDVGKLYRVGIQRQELCHDAFSIIIHSFWNDVPKQSLPGASKAVMHVGQGGMASTPAALQRNLEELYGHVLVFQHGIHNGMYAQPRCFDSQIPLWKRVETIMFATTFWAFLLRYHREMQHKALRRDLFSNHYQGSKVYAHQAPWEVIIEITDTLLRPVMKQGQQWSPRTSGSWSPEGIFQRKDGSKTIMSSYEEDRGKDELPYPRDAFLDVDTNFEEKWARRQSYYWEKIGRSHLLTRGVLKDFESSIYRIMALSEAELSSGISSYNRILRRMTEWCLAGSALSVVLDTWVKSEAGNYFRERMPAPTENFFEDASLEESFSFVMISSNKVRPDVNKDRSGWRSRQRS
jgi:hypothetical protein